MLVRAGNWELSPFSAALPTTTHRGPRSLTAASLRTQNRLLAIGMMLIAIVAGLVLWHLAKG